MGEACRSIRLCWLLLLLSAPAHSIIEIPLQKTVGETVENADGSLSVPVRLTLRNTGPRDASRVQVRDDLRLALQPAQFIAVRGLTVGGAFTAANSSFDGSADAELLGPDQELARGEAGSIEFVVDFKANGATGPLFNQATATARKKPVTGYVYETCSRPDGRAAEAAGCEPTRILLPQPRLGVAKSASATRHLQGDQFEVDLAFVLRNYGAASVRGLQLEDSLAQTFADALSFSVVSLRSAQFAVAADFDGAGQPRLLSGDDRLAPGASGRIDMRVRFDAGDAPSPFFNSAIGSDRQGNADTSTDGADPDPDGDGLPDEAHPTPITFERPPPEPVLGLAKSATDATFVGDRTFEVQLTYTLENLGDVTLRNVQLQDDLVALFASVEQFSLLDRTSTSLDLNSAYSGQSDESLLAPGVALDAGQRATVQLGVRFRARADAGELRNNALAWTDSVEDVSTDGPDPDPNGDGVPDEAQPTPIRYRIPDGSGPRLGLAKSATFARDEGGGRRRTTIHLRLRNYGDETATGVDIQDDLRATFARARSYEIVPGSLASDEFSLATDFDGSRQLSLLRGQDTLAPGASGSVAFDVRFVPDENTGEIFNSASARSRGDTVDVSQNGEDPDPNADTVPDEQEPTPIPYELPSPPPSPPDPVSGLLIDVVPTPGVTTVGRLVSYTISVTNAIERPQPTVTVVDHPPLGFRHRNEDAILVRAGADGRLGTDDDVRRPLGASGRASVTFDAFELAPAEQVQIVIPSRVTAAARVGPHPNTSRASSRISREVDAAAVVEVIDDPLFQKATIIGKVFHDRDRDGVQSPGEEGVAAARLITPAGLVVQTDRHGRYHIADINVPDTGANYLVKLDIDSLRNPGEGLLVHSDPKRLVRLVPGGIGKANYAVYWGLPPRRDDDCMGPFREYANFDQPFVEKRLDVVLEQVWTQGRGASGSHHLRFLTSSNYAEIAQCRGVRLYAKGSDTALETRVSKLGESLGVIDMTVPSSELPDVLEYELVSFAADADGRCAGAASDLAQSRAPSTLLPLPAAVDRTRRRSIETPTAATRYVGRRVTLGNSLARDVLPLPAAVPYLISRQHEQDFDVEERLVFDRSTIGPGSAGPELSPILRRNWDLLEPESALSAALGRGNRVETSGFARRPVQVGSDRGRVLVDRDVSFYQDNVRFTGDAGRAEMDCCAVRSALQTRVDASQQVYAVRFTNQQPNEVDMCWTFDAQPDNPADIAAVCWQGVNRVQLAPSATLEIFNGTFTPAAPMHRPDWNTLHVYVRDRLRAHRLSARAPSVGYRVTRSRGGTDARWKAPTTTGICGNVRSDFDFPASRLMASQKLVASAPDGAGGEVDPTYNALAELARLDHRRDRFAVLADVRLQANSARGELDALADANGLDGTAARGRVAGYWRGSRSVPAKDTHGAQAATGQSAPLDWVLKFDSGRDALSQLGDNVSGTNPRRLFRQLDPDDYNPTFGDDSTVLLDGHSQGSVYARIDYKDHHALWGNFDTSYTGTELGHYNRTLYGAQAQYVSTAATAFGERRHRLNLFASEAQTMSAHAAFLATGGSLYYLRHTDIVMGSAKVWVEVRRRDTAFVEERQTLVAGRDYELDPMHGRILLRRPLSQVVRQRHNPIVRNEALQGDDVYLLVDYEYVPAAFEANEYVYGLRARSWLNDRLGLGLTHVTDEQGAHDYRLHGLDLTYRHSRDSYVSMELGASDGGALETPRSATGGLLFESLAPLGGDVDGRAVVVEGRLDLADLPGPVAGSGLDGYVQTWWKRRDEGFVSSRYADFARTEDFGIDLDIGLGNEMRLLAGATSQRQRDIGQLTTARVQLERQWDCGLLRACWQLGVEARHDHLQPLGAAQPVLLPTGLHRDGRGSALGVRLAHRVSSRSTVYGSVQHDVLADGEYAGNRLLVVGVNRRLNDDTALSWEISDGDRGGALVAGLDFTRGPKAAFNLSSGVGPGALTQFSSRYELAEGNELYGTYTVDPDRTDGERTLMTLGQRRDLGRRLSVFNESQFGRDPRQASSGHVFGVNYELADNLTLATTLQASRVDGALGAFDRTAMSLGGIYRAQDWQLHSRIETRRDEGRLIDARQYVTSNRLRVRMRQGNANLTARLNAALVDDRLGSGTLGRFAEFDMGYALRPIAHDAFNGLLRYSYLMDVGTEGQSDAPGDERSHLLSAEGVWETSRLVQVKGRLALRNGRQRLQKGRGAWNSIDMTLLAAGLNVRLPRLGRADAPGDGAPDFQRNALELALEYRWLDDRSGANSREGWQVGLYQHVDPRRFDSNFLGSFKIGVGYNFSGFNDDLRSNSYRSEGAFVDLTLAF